MHFHELKRLILGEPLSNQMSHSEKIPKWQALAVLSSDALSSVAYATEEILIPLAAFGAAAVIWSLPIALAIVGLLLVVTISYRQTIDAYPSGGGAYIVAKENLGTYAGLVAGASLLIDYILTVAVSVAAGVENIGAAFPLVAAHKELTGALVILILTLLNLRGVRESATVFAFPPYLFILSFLIMIGKGLWMLMTGATPVESGQLISTMSPSVYPAAPLFLILHAFASGCSALTGVEAISNGIPMFREPSQKNAKITMTWMAAILATLFLGLTGLCHVFHLVPQPGQTAVSLVSSAVFGKTWGYYLVQVATALILVLAANTSYAGFPLLSSMLAKDRFLPRQLASVGDRLVFSNGIVGLSFAALFLLILFGGDTHHLIPLYAIGVFLSFTLAQTGMVLYHLREREQGWKISMFFNGLGALTTGLVLMVISAMKFADGAWMVVILIPFFVFVFRRINVHYLGVGIELSLQGVAPPKKLEPIKHTVIVPVSGIHRGVIPALQYALSISDDVRACYVEIDSAATERMKGEWMKWAHEVPFVVLKSPYRSVIRPLLEYIEDIEQTTHRDMITIIVPEFVTVKWWHQLLHNQTAFLIRAALLFKRGKVVTSVRYHLKHT